MVQPYNVGKTPAWLHGWLAVWVCVWMSSRTFFWTLWMKASAKSPECKNCNVLKQLSSFNLIYWKNSKKSKTHFGRQIILCQSSEPWSKNRCPDTRPTYAASRCWAWRFRPASCRTPWSRPPTAWWVGDAQTYTDTHTHTQTRVHTHKYKNTNIKLLKASSYFSPAMSLSNRWKCDGGGAGDGKGWLAIVMKHDNYEDDVNITTKNILICQLNDKSGI